MLQFSQAAQQVLVVICDEPASLTDAYALIKILSRDHGVTQLPGAGQPCPARPAKGRRCSSSFERVAGRFLDVTLDYAGEIPEDAFLRRAIRAQRPVLTAYPASPAGPRIQETRRHRRYVACAGRPARQSGVLRRAPDQTSGGRA